MSAACRRFPTPSTTPSRSSARPISRCRTTTGATGGRPRSWECLRLDDLLPSLHALLRVAGRGRGWGVSPLAPLAASLLSHPPPPPPPPPLAGGGGEKPLLAAPRPREKKLQMQPPRKVPTHPAHT